MCLDKTFFVFKQKAQLFHFFFQNVFLRVLKVYSYPGKIILNDFSQGQIFCLGKNVLSGQINEAQGNKINHV